MRTTGRPSRGRSAWALRTAALVLSPVLLVTVWAWWHPAWAATKAGDAKIVTPAEGSSPGGAPLGKGDAATPFTLALPTGASCRGDSANDGYRVQSYMVPESVDPATLQFGSVGPTPTGVGGAFRQPLFTTTTDPVVNHQTAAATKRPGPGPIVNIPAVNLSVFKAGDVPAGSYNVGIACTKGGASATQLDTYWNTKLVVASASGGGAAISWEAPASAATPSSPAATGSDAQPAAPGGPAPGGGGPISDAASGQPGASADGGPAGAGSSSSADNAPKPSAPSGAPPSFGLPVARLATQVDMIGSTRLTAAGWVALLLLVIRVGMLLMRPHPTAPARTA